VAALTERSAERGLARVEYEGYNPSGYRTVKDQLGFDAEARRQAPQGTPPRGDHRDELGRAGRPRRGLHGLEAPPPTHEESGAERDDDGAHARDPERERQAARRYWARRRGEFLASVLGGRPNKTVVVDVALRTLIEEAGANASRRAAQLLGLTAHDEQGCENWNRALVEHANENGTTIVRVAAAVSAAHGEDVLRNGYREPAAYHALLQSLGYEPHDGEFPGENSSTGEPTTPAV
jgi:hypothetical protein